MEVLVLIEYLNTFLALQTRHKLNAVVCVPNNSWYFIYYESKVHKVAVISENHHDARVFDKTMSCISWMASLLSFLIIMEQSLKRKAWSTWWKAIFVGQPVKALHNCTFGIYAC